MNKNNFILFKSYWSVNIACIDFVYYTDIFWLLFFRQSSVAYIPFFYCQLEFVSETIPELLSCFAQANSFVDNRYWSGRLKKLSKFCAVGNWMPTQQILMCDCANVLGHQFAQLFASEQNFVGHYFAQLFMLFALFFIYCYSKVSADFKGNLTRQSQGLSN